MSDTFIIDDTSYAGEAAGQFIRKAITGADTLNGGHCYVKDGIKKRFTIPRIAGTYSDIIQDYAPTPTAQGELTVSKQTLDPQLYQVYSEFNPIAWREHWYAVQQQPELMDRTLPQSAASVVIQQYSEYHAKFFNNIIWNGDTTASGASSFLKYFDGWIKQIKNGTGTNLVASPTTLTAGNIFAEMEKGYTLIPEALKFDTDMQYYVSYNTWLLFQKAQTDQTYKGIDITKSGEMTFHGLYVNRIADFPDNTYCIVRGNSSPSSNLWVGLNSTGDDTNIKLQKLQANSDYMFLRMIMAADVTVGWFEETVFYGS